MGCEPKLWAMPWGEPLAALLDRRGNDVRPAAAALSALENANRLGRPLMEMLGDFTHMHLIGFFGLGADCERLAIALAKRGADSLRCCSVVRETTESSSET
jgi:hypothetical protein